MKEKAVFSDVAKSYEEELFLFHMIRKTKNKESAEDLCGSYLKMGVSLGFGPNSFLAACIRFSLAIDSTQKIPHLDYYLAIKLSPAQSDVLSKWIDWYKDHGENWYRNEVIKIKAHSAGIENSKEHVRRVNSNGVVTTGMWASIEPNGWREQL